MHFQMEVGQIELEFYKSLRPTVTLNTDDSNLGLALLSAWTILFLCVYT